MLFKQYLNLSLYNEIMEDLIWKLLFFSHNAIDEDHSFESG
jgi:hypothetical protein